MASNRERYSAFFLERKINFGSGGFETGEHDSDYWDQRDETFKMSIYKRCCAQQNEKCQKWKSVKKWKSMGVFTCAVEVSP